MVDFALDVQCVDPDTWTQSFSWPVSYLDLIAMEDEIKGVFFRAIADAHPERAAALLGIEYKTLHDMAATSFALCALQRLTGRTLRYGPRSTLFRGLLQQGIPEAPRVPLLTLPRMSPWRRLKSRVPVMKKQALLRPGSRMLQSPYVIHHAQVSHLLLEYIRTQIGGWAQVIHEQDLYRFLDPPWQRPAWIDDFAESVTEQVAQVVTRHHVSWSMALKTYYRELLSRRLTDADQHLTALERALGKRRPGHLLVGSGGATFTRVLAFAARRCGWTVTGCRHGEPFFHDWDYYTWLDGLGVDHLLAHNTAGAKVLQRVLKQHPPADGHSVEAGGMGTQHFAQLCGQYRPTEEKTIRRVMLIGRGLETASRVGQGLALPDLVHLDWEIRLCRCLSQSGFEVIYKGHPLGQLRAEIPRLLRHATVEVETPFEAIVQNVDALVMWSTMSTTSGHALVTDKPLVYLKPPWEPWDPEMFDHFSRRCSVVEMWIDETNRLQCDEQEFLEAVAHSPERRDPSFLHTYMLN
jgi:hypothetical protein